MKGSPVLGADAARSRLTWATDAHPLPPPTCRTFPVCAWPSGRCRRALLWEGPMGERQAGWGEEPILGWGGASGEP